MIAWRTVFEMTYNVSRRTLNLTHSLTDLLHHCVRVCVKVISKLHKACLLYDEWKSDNRPTFKPWLYPEQSCLPALDTDDIIAMKYSATCADLLGESDATEEQVAADMVESDRLQKDARYF